MATAVEMEASPPTDAGWEGGGGGDEEMRQALPEFESSPQNGGGGLSIAEPGGGGLPEDPADAGATPNLCPKQPLDFCEAGAAALPKGPEEPDRPVRRSFQIPRKSREKKGGASLFPNPLFLSPLHLFIRIALALPTPLRDT